MHDAVCAYVELEDHAGADERGLARAFAIANRAIQNLITVLDRRQRDTFAAAITQALTSTEP